MSGATIRFYAPGLKRYRTSEYAGQEPGRFVSISVTGAECALACDHCNARVLEGMRPLRGARLYDVCAELAARGARGVLVSGGCDRRGRVPLLRHVPDLIRTRRELGLVIRVHPGLPDEETAAALGEVDADGAMLDVIGAEETIREVYHLDVRVTEYGRALERLERHGVPLIPHIVLGLHYGRMLGEWRALEMVAERRVMLLVLVVLTPLYGTAMAAVAPPPVEEIARFFADARRALPETPISLGCARPIGPLKYEIDRLAVDAGFAGIAYPAEGIVAYAESRGRRPEFHDACCGISFGGEFRPASNAPPGIPLGGGLRPPFESSTRGIAPARPPLGLGATDGARLGGGAAVP